jgi:hypothetical protein
MSKTNKESFVESRVFPDVPVKELPLYQSLKQVRAAKISHIDVAQVHDRIESFMDIKKGGRPKNEAFAATIIMDVDEGNHVITIVSADYIHKHTPMVGGYLVQYEDGYVSYSPPDIFERSHVRLPELPPDAAPDVKIMHFRILHLIAGTYNGILTLSSPDTWAKLTGDTNPNSSEPARLSHLMRLKTYCKNLWLQNAGQEADSYQQDLTHALTPAAEKEQGT